MALILNIETATTVCSVALAQDGNLLSLKEMNEGYTHAENITLFIEDVLREAGKKITELDAVAVSSGPGSYTGLRIGVSAAKGLCYALEKPLIAVSTLKSLATGFLVAFNHNQNSEETSSINPGYYLSDPKNYQRNFPRALSFRKHPTEAEEILWQELKGKKTGYKFRRQHVIDQFIVDFVCISKKLIVEVDGEIHHAQKDYDEGRQAVLEKFGFKIIRFSNEEVLKNVYAVIGKIKSSLVAQPNLPSPSSSNLSPGPFPKERGDLSANASHKVLPFGKDLGWVIPMIDARRMEVYCAVYDEKLNEIEKVSARIINENSFSAFLKEKKIYFFGDGAEKCKTMLAQQPNAIFIDDIFSSAASMISHSEQKFKAKKFEDVALFEPFYLKEFTDGKKSNP